MTTLRTFPNSPVRRKARNLLAALLAIAALFGAHATLWAHPMGNFTVNRYAQLEVDNRQVWLFYVIDMAEIPTQQEIAVIDHNRDGQMSDAEIADYLADMTQMAAANAHLFLNGRHVTWRIAESDVVFPPGQADLPTLRLEARFVADLPPGAQTWEAEFLDDNYADRLGWHEIIVRALPGAAIRDSSAPVDDLSNALRDYPDELLLAPPRVNRATFQAHVAPGAAGDAPRVQPAPAAAGQPNRAITGIDAAPDRFARLIASEALGPGAWLLVLAAAFGWGAVHALSPGHGKTIVGAYLVGSRGTARHALLLGVTTTVTHTAGVFALGFVTLFLSRYILPETLYPWLGLASGVLVVVIGLSLAWGRVGALLGFRAGGHPHSHAHDHEHDHSHDHGWPHDHSHEHEHGHGHTHVPPSQVTWRGLLLLGVSGGLIPCPSALVLMLGAIALDRVALGLVLILLFSLGLASVLTAIGLALVYAGRLFDRIPEGGRLLRVMPVASALVITVIGVGIAWQALLQTGVLSMG